MAINTGVPLISGDPDSPVVGLLEDLAWNLSDSNRRADKPEKPTSMWTRLEKRRQAESESHRKGDR